MQLNAAQSNYSTSATCKANKQTTQADIRRNLTHSLSGDTGSTGARCIQVRSIRACFHPGDSILEQASTHHTDYTKLNTALCQHRQEADQSADVRTEGRSLPATGYMSAGQCTYPATALCAHPDSFIWLTCRSWGLILLI